MEYYNITLFTMHFSKINLSHILYGDEIRTLSLLLLKSINNFVDFIFIQERFAPLAI